MNAPADTHADGTVKHKMIVVLVGLTIPVPPILFIVRRGGFVVLAHASVWVRDADDHQNNPDKMTVAKCEVHD